MRGANQMSDARIYHGENMEVEPKKIHAMGCRCPKCKARDRFFYRRYLLWNRIIQAKAELKALEEHEAERLKIK
jgi:hypothetical protein